MKDKLYEQNVRTDWNDFLRIFLIVFSVLIFVGISVAGDPINVRMTTAAWKAFNDKKYEDAIKKAEECIDEFEPTALRQQKELEESKISLPPVGKVEKTQEDVIFSRGLLNDVATCWFIKGRSLEKLKRTEEAIHAYKKAEGYTYARTWDTNWEGFWSPSKTAKDRRFFLEK